MERSLTGMNCDIIVGPISVYGYIGAYKEEKFLGKEFIITAYYSYNCKEAVLNDDLYKSIDYTKIVEIIKNTVKISKDDLIETTAFKIKNIITKNIPNIENLYIEIEKRNPPIEGVSSFKVKV